MYRHSGWPRAGNWLSSGGTRTRFGELEKGRLARGPRPPQLTSVLPGTLTEGSPETTVIVRGLRFVPASKVFLERVPLDTKYVSPTELRAVVPARLTRTAGTYFLRVRTPRPGGGDSAPAPLTVTFP